MGILKDVHNLLAKKTRAERLEIFDRTIGMLNGKKILDLGGTTYIAESKIGRKNLTVLNISERTVKWLKSLGINAVVGDGCKMNFGDKSFNVVISTAVIEHVGDWQKQKKFANEIRRVGKKYFVTTPNKWFWIDPHYRLPFFHLLPIDLRRWLVENFSVGGKPKGEWIDIYPLDEGQMKELFPEAEIIKQKWFGQEITLIAAYGGAKKRRRSLRKSGRLEMRAA